MFMVWCGVVVATEMDEEDKKRTTEIEEREIERERERGWEGERERGRESYMCVNTEVGTRERI